MEISEMNKELRQYRSCHLKLIYVKRIYIYIYITISWIRIIPKLNYVNFNTAFWLANISPQDYVYDTEDAEQFLYWTKRAGDKHACVIIQTS